MFFPLSNHLFALLNILDIFILKLFLVKKDLNIILQLIVYILIIIICFFFKFKCCFNIIIFISIKISIANNVFNKIIFAIIIFIINAKLKFFQVEKKIVIYINF